MSDKKPCIVISERRSGVSVYTAVSEHRSRIMTCRSYNNLTLLLDNYNWQIMPLYSRFARTILDKLEGHRV